MYELTIAQKRALLKAEKEAAREIKARCKALALDIQTSQAAHLDAKLDSKIARAANTKEARAEREKTLIERKRKIDEARAKQDRLDQTRREMNEKALAARKDGTRLLQNGSAQGRSVVHGRIMHTHAIETRGVRAPEKQYLNW